VNVTDGLALTLGSGSFGTVYLGEWQHTKVAIKVDSSMSRQSVNTFLREVVMSEGILKFKTCSDFSLI